MGGKQAWNQPQPLSGRFPHVLTNCRLHSFPKALQTTDASQAQGWALGTQRWPWPPGSIHRAREETDKQPSNNSTPTGMNRGKKAKETALESCPGELGVVASDLTRLTNTGSSHSKWQEQHLQRLRGQELRADPCGWSVVHRREGRE